MGQTIQEQKQRWRPCPSSCTTPPRLHHPTCTTPSSPPATSSRPSLRKQPLQAGRQGAPRVGTSTSAAQCASRQQCQCPSRPCSRQGSLMCTAGCRRCRGLCGLGEGGRCARGAPVGHVFEAGEGPLQGPGHPIVYQHLQGANMGEGGPEEGPGSTSAGESSVAAAAAACSSSTQQQQQQHAGAAAAACRSSSSMQEQQQGAPGTGLQMRDRCPT